ncbi:MAG: NAD-binding protein [Methanobrevibacter sp.]|jgi:trk system potassium uptake protein TrkA|nr:NAD-binding protein [Methanobrevibacter sp.]
MYVIIMGAGRVGITLAEFLIGKRYDITVIESRKTECNKAVSELDAIVICGNGTNTKILEESNISDADFFVAVTGNDETNLLTCILAKNYGVPKVISRMSNLDHRDAFKKVGIDYVISPEMAAAGFLERLISRPNATDLTEFGRGDAEILDMNITNIKINGKRVSEVSPTDDYILIALYRQGNLKIPKPDDILSKGDNILVLVKKGMIKKVNKAFTS